MPNCVVKGCKNQSARNKKHDGITFHIFPVRDPNMYHKWITAIRNSRNEPAWQPTPRSVVCSAHFKNEDLYYTVKGLRRVKRNAFPQLQAMHLSDGSDIKDSQKVCIEVTVLHTTYSAVVNQKFKTGLAGIFDSGVNVTLSNEFCMDDDDIVFK